jgi:tellurite resistance protein TerC
MAAEFPTWTWIVFAGVLFPLLFLDLYVHRGGRHSSRGAAIAWSIVWVAVGLAFTFFVWAVGDGRAAQEYLAAYLIEKSLSLDNLFVFLLVFASLRVPPKLQHTALTWGIFGALVFRAIFVFAGAAALRQWHWVNYVFGAILFVAALHALREHPDQVKESKLARWLSRHMRVTDKVEGPHFFVVRNGRRYATPLLVAVIALELTDVMFAVDSVPAALAVTRHEFLVYSSNAFAILGLRALYLVLARTISQMRYLHYGLAGVLAFAGLKLVASEWMKVPPLVSVAIIVLMVGAAIWASVRATRHEHPDRGEPRPI